MTLARCETQSITCTNAGSEYPAAEVVQYASGDFQARCEVRAIRIRRTDSNATGDVTVRLHEGDLTGTSPLSADSPSTLRGEWIFSAVQDGTTGYDSVQSVEVAGVLLAEVTHTLTAEATVAGTVVDITMDVELED